MAITVTSNMTLISNCDTTTGWSAGDSNTVDQLEGSGCLSEQVKATTGGVNLFTLSSAVDLTNKFIIMTMKVNGVADTKANGGYRIYIEDSSGNQSYWYVGGNDTHTGGWGYFAIDPSTTPTSGTADYTDILKVGVQFKTLTSVVGTASNCFWDICHYGTGLKVTSDSTETSGSGPNGECSFEDIYNEDSGTNANYYGIITKVNGVYFIRGILELGDDTGTLSIDFEDNGSIVVFNADEFMTDNLTKITISGNSTGTTNVKLPNCFISSATRAYTLNANDTDITEASFDGATLNGAADSDMSAGLLDNIKFDACGQIDPGTASLVGTTFSNSSNANGALLLDASGTTNISDLKFISDGTGHAIYITDTGTYTFDNFSFSGYASTDGTTGNECIYNNSGGAVTINIIGGDTPTIRNGTGASTTLVVNPVTTKVTVKDLDAGTVIENARVLVWATDNTNYFYEASVTITGSSTTATVTHTSHGLSTGDNVIIKGANEDVYNGVYSVTVVDADTYTYTTNETISTSPATGTILSTFAILNGLTDTNGEISDTRSLSADQTISGWVRKSTTSPYYKQGVISGTISNTSGFDTTIQLVSDE